MFLWNLFNFIQKNALYIAIENNNTEIVRLLLANENIDINLPSILFIDFNKISNQSI